MRLLCVGKPREPAAIQLHDDYARRIVRLGCTYDTGWVREVRAGGRYSDDHVRQREARALVEALDPGDRLVALDRRGRELTSEELARQLPRWTTPRATLVVGGPLGLHDSLVERADRTWSLSRLTLPHELVRVVVAEQLYRALTLMRGLPYHK